MSLEGSDTKEIIQIAGIKLLNSHGYGGLSLSAITKQSGLTKQRIHYHYPDITELVVELAMRWSSTGQQKTLEYLAGTKLEKAQKILSVAEATFSWIEDDPELARLAIVLYQAAPQIKKLEKFMIDAQLVARARIKKLLELDEKFEKLTARKLDALTTQIHACIYGNSFYTLLLLDKAGVKSCRESCLNTLKQILEFEP